MIGSITNNKILEGTLTEKFVSSLESTLLPLLAKKYAKDSVGIFMYEDFLREDMLIDGAWHYPMTLIIDGASRTEWVKWTLDEKSFKDKNPYSYIGDGEIDFALCDMPTKLSDKFADYIGYTGQVGVKIEVEAISRDITFLSGRYSQRFVDEMSRQITERIESLMSCGGLRDSSLSLLLAFAPESYFEHTSENTTYRRLLLIDKGSAPRDFWVKWTRLDSAVGYSVSDAPTADTVRFEVGEDVPHKIREKEYRYLLREGRDKYQGAMARKSVTEWREVIRRAIRRGELSKVEQDTAEVVFEDDLSAKLKSVLGDSFTPAPMTVETPEAPMGDDYLKALELAKSLVGATEEPIAEPSATPDTAEEIVIPDNAAEISFDIFDADGDESEGDFVIPEGDGEPLFIEIDSAEAPTLEEIEEEAPEIVIAPEAPMPEKEIEIPAEKKEPAPAPTEQKVKVITTYTESPAESERVREAEARAAEYAIRLEYEKQLREKLEAELSALKEREAALQRESFEAKRVLAEREEAFRRAEEEFKLTVAKLTAQNELLAKSEEKQKERLAGAARDALERQKELEAQRQLAEAQKKLVEEQNARLVRVAADSAVKAHTPTPSSAPTDNYTYVSRSVKLLFRHSVDPNVLGRIHEIIKATIEYFGKENVKLRIRAAVADNNTVSLEFLSIPLEEIQLLSSIIQVLGSSGLGIAKAIVE